MKYADVKDLTTDKVEDVHTYTEQRNGNSVIMVDLTMVDPKRKGSVSLGKKRNLDNCIYFIDGKEAKKEDVDNLDQSIFESMYVWLGEKAVEKFGEKGKNGVIDIRTKRTTPENVKVKSIIKPAVTDTVPNADAATLLQAINDKDPDTATVVANFSEMKSFGVDTTIRLQKLEYFSGKSNTPLYIMDGKEVADIKDISPYNIASITVWKGTDAMQRFGDKGKYGVVDVRMKKTAPAPIP